MPPKTSRGTRGVEEVAAQRPRTTTLSSGCNTAQARDVGETRDKLSTGQPLTHTLSLAETDAGEHGASPKEPSMELTEMLSAWAAIRRPVPEDGVDA